MSRMQKIIINILICVAMLTAGMWCLQDFKKWWVDDAVHHLFFCVWWASFFIQGCIYQMLNYYDNEDIKDV